MKSAKEMFELNGYEIDEENEKEILYKKKWEYYVYWVSFNLEYKNVECFITSDRAFENYKSHSIDISLLQAINKQVEELHWKVD